MPIFDDNEKTLLGGASHIISQFDYLNASARTEAGEVRGALERYFERYPEQHRKDLRSRLRSVIDRQHLAATFELILHEVLLSSGCVIEEIEPTVPASNSRPDFLVRASDGQRFYLEAVVPSGLSNVQAGAERRMDDALHAIDQVNSGSFYLSVFTEGLPEQPVPVGALRKSIQEWVGGLDYDAVKAAWDVDRARPRFEQTHHGAQFRIEPIPRSTKPGSLPDRAIGVRMGGVKTVEDHVSIREAVIKKANRYGALDLPFIVAVNSMGEFSKEDQAVMALFGTEAVGVRLTEDGGYETVERRVPDGVWYGPHGPRKTGVSAVLSTEGLTPWSLGQRPTRLLLNPWAKHPLTPPIPIDVRQVEKDHLMSKPGKSLRDVLGLPEDWPE